jgi:hypothetical protein
MTLRAFLFFLLLVPTSAACTADSESAPTARSTFAFTPDTVDAWRNSSHAECGEADEPYAPDDGFMLRPRDLDSSAKLSTIVLSFRASAPKSVALRIGDDREAAFDADSDILLQIGVTEGSPKKKLAAARVELGDLPKADGQPLSVHLTLDFEDGDVLSETISAPVASTFGSCPTGP